jgi:tRNA (guanine-N7-)-methyltransferase
MRWRYQDASTRQADGMGPVERPPMHRPVRTFQPRRSRIGATRQQALIDLLPRFALDRKWLPSSAESVIVEIGCGAGDAAIELATRRPEVHVVACDVHTPGIGSLVQQLDARQLSNVSVYVGDALDLIESLPDACLVGINVFFPDPWPKARHAQRRLFQPSFVETVARVLRTDGVLHLATDVARYADDATRCVEAVDALVRRNASPQRATTAFERRAATAGRSVIDRAWIKQR